ncbi:MAG: ScnB-like protein [Pseudomonadota bacterium]
MAGSDREDVPNFARGPHDLGGLPGGPIERDEHAVTLWEKRVDALLVLLAKKDVFSVDELRNGIERLGADAYEKLSYYERWTASIAWNLMQRGVISADELGRRMAEIEKTGRQ